MRHWVWTIGAAVMLGLASLVLAWAMGGITGSFLGPDESAHYVNTLFLADWLRAGLPSPMGFARDYYVHYPKLSIGHWPPGWYALLAPGFALIWPSPLAAAMFSAFVAGLPCVLVLWGLARTGHPRVGLAAAFAMLLSPLVIESAQSFLLDQPVALVVGLGAIAWLRAAERPGWGRFLLFGALAAFAPLVKGNGALIALVPAIEILLARRWHLLRDRRLWAVAAATLLVVAPWYYVSFRISAGGFNYAPGAAYAWLALSTNSAALVDDLGWVGLVLAIAGIGMGWRDAQARPVVRLAVAVIVATLAFQSIVPVALDPRYMLPAIPWMVMPIALTLVLVWRRGGQGRVAAGMLAVAASIAPVMTLIPMAPKRDMAAPAIVAAMRDAPGIWLVDGRAGGEGAIIAEAAYQDRGSRRLWTARASQWLSGSDFMGHGYHLIAHDPAEAAAILDRIGTAGAVIVRDRARDAYPHSAVLRHLVQGGGYRVVRHPFAQGTGEVIVAVHAQPVTPHPERLSDASVSRNLNSMTR
ncbi:ArnT family glycosyltransferase [Sphingomonas fuzhouensis]|uniref:ArnT family glycosyltransferase n=1 Tax=Sphingomonas fuzhouensis TaxID=3106033 RepID=UPI002AFDE02D|nr:glycosyltransferase family 39 protein [Sphingomonas sp. SGZ-02]